MSERNVCLSGGALGADLAWGEAALAHEHGLIHFIFDGHRSPAPKPYLHVLTPDELAVADQYVARANETLKRRWPNPNKFVSNLLRRNYYQIVWTDSLYAISTFKDRKVAGGTAWAVQMYLDRFDDATEKPCYVFDQVAKVWTQWDGEGFLEIEKPPTPSGTWTGIGTREINNEGLMAIQEVWMP